MKEIGKTIRKIRLSKGYTQKEVYSDIVSKSYAIEFEKGKHDMTVSNFQKVLDYLRVDYVEFKFIHQAYQAAPLKTKYNRYADASNRNDLKELQKLQGEIKGSKNEKDKLLEAQIALAITRTSHEDETTDPFYPSEKIDIISRYLMAVETWTLQEISIFSNNLVYFPLETRMILMDSALKNLDKYKNFHDYNDMLAGLLINSISKALIDNNYDLGWYYLTKLHRLSQETFSGWQREIYLFFLGCYNILQGDVAAGKKMCQHLFEYFELTGYTERMPDFTNFLNFFLKKSKDI